SRDWSSDVCSSDLGTALGLGVVAVALVLTVALAALGRVVAARGAAQGAADLAALAAATRLEGPGGDAEAACRVAVELAAASGVRVERCTVSGREVELGTARDAGPGLVARATARAGPAPRRPTPGRRRGGSAAPARP